MGRNHITDGNYDDSVRLKTSIALFQRRIMVEKDLKMKDVSTCAQKRASKQVDSSISASRNLNGTDLIPDIVLSWTRAHWLMKNLNVSPRVELTLLELTRNPLKVAYKHLRLFSRQYFRLVPM